MTSNYGLDIGTAGIITGASSGIGRALAVHLAQKLQARLVLNARNESLLQETADLVRQAGGQAVVVAGDISDKRLVDSMADTCLSQFNRMDLLVNNAGFGIPGAVHQLTPNDWRKVFDVNFFGALYGVYAVLPYFIENKKGKIVNVASVAGKVSFPGSVCYAASKFAMTGMSEGMAAEFCRSNIDVITVCPGWVRTEFFQNAELSSRNNPTLIAQRKDLVGWIMRNCLSISAEETADEILKACQKGGSQEIVLTVPGVVMERLAGLAPSLAFRLARMIEPLRYEKDVPAK